MSDSPITLFVPFGEGYGNPGLTIRADSLDELDEILAGVSDSVDDDPDSVSKLDSILDGVLTIKAAVALKFPQKTVVTQNMAPSTHPQAKAQPDSAPSCNHGPMKYREGTARGTGNPYKGWFCPAPQGTPGGQCKPQFVK